MTNVTIDHVVIAVSDWERANRFYGEVLGAEIVPKGNGFVYRLGGALLNVHGPDTEAAPLAGRPVVPGNSDFCVAWHGTLDEAKAHLAQHDVAVELGPVDRTGAQGPGQSLYVRDPDGSLVEFITYA